MFGNSSTTSKASISCSWLLPSGWKRLVAVLTALACFGLLCGSPIQARADYIDGHKYMYTSGAPQDITNNIICVGLNYYLDLPQYEEPEPIILDYDNGHIYDDLTSAQIGFIYSSPPP